MGKLIREGDDTGRLHVESPLMGESLVSKALMKRTEAKEYFRMHPDINVLKIGGQSIMDRGAKALLPVLDALITAKERHKILLMTGGGTRARVDHVLPTGLSAHHLRHPSLRLLRTPGRRRKHSAGRSSPFSNGANA
jgi:molybdenum storage protein